MYKLLLCLRYLQTRYLAFVCIVSVMLGVATLIVVNSVMDGFSNKLKDRLRAMMSDVRIETDQTNGFEMPPDELIKRIQGSQVGHQIESISPTVEMFALVQFTYRGHPIMLHVRLVGVDPVKQARVGGFSEYLVRQKNVAEPSFALSEEAMQRYAMSRPAPDWNGFDAPLVPTPQANPAVKGPLDFLPPPPMVPPVSQAPRLPPPTVDPAPPVQLSGAIIGQSIARQKFRDPETGLQREVNLLEPGDEIFVTTVGASGTRPVSSRFLITDYFRSEMSEYDSGYLYVPLEDLQRMRGMGDRVNAMQMRLKNDVRDNSKYVHNTILPSLQQVVDSPARVRSWEQQQGALLAAIDIEKRILNVLLFLIVGVAGFGVLAIFSMIVSEKYRDIGILKSLGAGSGGVMSIFLSYGLLLGGIGCGAGTVLGLIFTRYINQIEQALARLSGKQVFDRSVYYFDRIPTDVDPINVALVNLGALLIAVVFSILPAVRAARLQPVRALRFE